jgi:hypothetical protein
MGYRERNGVSTANKPLVRFAHSGNETSNTDLSYVTVDKEMKLKRNQKVAYAVLAALSASAGTVYAADSSIGIDEIIVTAQRRNESIQDVPITIQAISGDALRQLGVVSFSDLLRYTPNVTYSGNGPGTGNIFMRGLSSGGSGNQSQSTTAPFPNVALYLDDQSMQFPARNNDVYMVDMERVEVLEGPQGTLFGGGSEAGAIRYITNKPKLGVTEGTVNAAYGVTAGGDPNNLVNMTLNLPINDKFALRGTFFSDHRGGYITNVPGTISVPAVTSGDSPPLRPGSAEYVNNSNPQHNFNPVTTTGFRLSGLYQINDDWSALLQQNYQNFQADGVFYEEPVSPAGQALAPHQVVSFTPNFSKDKYESTALTVNGKIGDLKAVYAGSYMVRHIEAQQDYSNYMTSRHGSYYACSGQGSGYAYFQSSKPTTCYSPIGSWNDQVINTHQSHEFRLTTPDDRRIRGTLGAYYESFEIKDNMNFNYMPIPQCTPANYAAMLNGGPDCVEAVGPKPGYYATDPSLRVNTQTAFGEDVRRGYKQTAFFTSWDVDLIPKVLTATYGIRHYSYKEYEEGSEYYSATSSILDVPNGTPFGGTFTNPNGNDPCPDGRASTGGVCPGAAYGFGINLHKKESGNRSRANLSWHVTPDVLAYYTWSQGFRPGGFNRTKTNLDGSVISLKGVAKYEGVKQFYKPAGYISDNLVNNEIGIKSEFLDHRVQLNVSAYKMDWTNVQLPLFDPVHLGNTTFDINGPSYQVKGVEVQLVARVTQALTVQGSSSWNSSSQTNAPCLKGNIPDTHFFGQCITSIDIGGVATPYTNPYGVLGTSPAFSPPLQFNLRARYDFTVGEYNAFWSIGGNHVGSMRTEPASFPDGDGPGQNPPTTTLLKYVLPAYTTYDGSIGIAKDNWTAELVGSNLSNSHSPTNISSAAFIKTVYPVRPRVLMLQVGYKF